MSTNLEEWRDIPGYEGHYQVSDIGRVKSLARMVYRPHTGRVDSWAKPEKILRQTFYGSTPNRRRFYVNLYLDGKSVTKLVNRLVLQAFVGPAPDGMECCHNNGDPTDNSLGNLRWDTNRGNGLDRILHGTDDRGEKSAMAKLTNVRVLEIRALAGSDTQKNIGQKFGVVGGTIRDIITRKTWTHI